MSIGTYTGRDGTLKGTKRKKRNDVATKRKKRPKKNTTRPQNELSISEMIATTTTTATITHEGTTPALEVGNYVTVTGHVGSVRHLAMNQRYTIVRVISPTTALVNGKEMSIGTYRDGTLKGTKRKKRNETKKRKKYTTRPKNELLISEMIVTTSSSSSSSSAASCNEGKRKKRKKKAKKNKKKKTDNEDSDSEDSDSDFVLLFTYSR